MRGRSVPEVRRVDQNRSRETPMDVGGPPRPAADRVPLSNLLDCRQPLPRMECLLLVQYPNVLCLVCWTGRLPTGTVLPEVLLRHPS